MLTFPQIYCHILSQNVINRVLPSFKGQLVVRRIWRGLQHQQRKVEIQLLCSFSQMITVFLRSYPCVCSTLDPPLYLATVTDRGLYSSSLWIENLDQLRPAASRNSLYPTHLKCWFWYSSYYSFFLRIENNLFVSIPFTISSLPTELLISDLKN